MRPSFVCAFTVFVWFALAMVTAFLAAAITESGAVALLVASVGVFVPMWRLRVEPRGYLVAAGVIVTSMMASLVFDEPRIALLAMLPWAFAWARAAYSVT